mgnify:CR=1 FL=1
MSRISSQFGDMQAYEGMQRRRFARRHESGCAGNGYNYPNYPYMVSAMAVGSNQIVQSDDRYKNAVSNYRQKAGRPVSNGLGTGGTAAFATGMAGGGQP